MKFLRHLDAIINRHPETLDELCIPEDVTTSIEPQIEISEESQNDTIPVPNNDFTQADTTSETPPKQLRRSSQIRKTPDHFNPSEGGMLYMEQYEQ